MGTIRPDIYACMDGIQIAIEVQLSTLTLERIIYRTSEYAKKGIYVSLVIKTLQAIQDPQSWKQSKHLRQSHSKTPPRATLGKDAYT